MMLALSLHLTTLGRLNAGGMAGPEKDGRGFTTHPPFLLAN